MRTTTKSWMALSAGTIRLALVATGCSSSGSTPGTSDSASGSSDERITLTVAQDDDPTLVEVLRTIYEDVRQGLGHCKSPEVYGAFPVDPYSHTPAGCGARQPGMTGQVKEEVLTRLGELGLRVEEGRIVVRPVLLRREEWTTAPTVFRYVDVAGEERAVGLAAWSLAFTFCQVPVIYRRGAALELGVEHSGGTVEAFTGAALPEEVSAEIFRRTGRVAAIHVTLPVG